MRSIPDNQDTAQSLDKIARNNGTFNGAAVDSGQDHFQRMGVIDLGAWTAGTGLWTFEARQKTTDSWVTLPAEELDDPGDALETSGDANFVSVTDATKDDTIIQIGLLTIDRFVRAVNVSTDDTPGAIGGVNIVSASKRYAGGVGQPMAPEGVARPVLTI